jgi:hypothetical protein
VFLSRPSALSAHRRAVFESWCAALADRGLELRTLAREEYTPDPWAPLQARIRAAQAVVAFGFRHVEVTRGVRAPATAEATAAPAALASPWVQIEAGLALAAGRRVLALAEPGVTDGVFDPATWGSQVVGGDLTDEPDGARLDELLWALASARPAA